MRQLPASKQKARNQMNALVEEPGKSEKTKVELPKTPQPDASKQTQSPKAGRGKPMAARKRALLMIALPAVIFGGGLYYWMAGGRYEETENAYLEQAKITIASDISGRVVSVGISDNEHVKAGDLLFKVDPEPYRIALNKADASVAAARLNVEQLRAAYNQALTQKKVAADEVAYQQSQFDRKKELAKKGISSKSDLDQAELDLNQAKEKLATAEQAIGSARAALGGDPAIETDAHPTVLAALAAREQAAYELNQTTVRAPADGIVYKAASFKPGQYVAAGSPLFSLVETGDTWVDANFKETQLTNMRPGQKADVTFDIYPDKTFKASVEAIGAGTGAEFSLLPAQNATGNWVKVTQRIPVSLRLDDADGSEMLRTGMSAKVTVDTGASHGFSALLPFASAAENK
jgi:membrane fusion protein (multidrug efflux system)